MLEWCEPQLGPMEYGLSASIMCHELMSDSIVVRRGNGLCASHERIHTMCHELVHVHRELTLMGWCEPRLGPMVH